MRYPYEGLLSEEYVSTLIPEVLASSASLPPPLPSRQLSIMLPFSSAALCISIDLECALKIVHELHIGALFQVTLFNMNPQLTHLK